MNQRRPMAQPGPCPFCLSDKVECAWVRAIRTKRGVTVWEGPKRWRMRCQECLALGSEKRTKREAVEMWSAVGYLVLAIRNTIKPKAVA